MRKSLLGISLCALVLVVACGKKKPILGKPLEVPEYTALKNMSEAPPKIREASEAVVKIAAGTGFFISTEGLLMTNNHVLGATNCALQGCHVDLHFDLPNRWKI